MLNPALTMQKLNLKQDQQRAQVLFMATKTELFTLKLMYYALQMPFRPAVTVTKMTLCMWMGLRITTRKTDVNKPREMFL